MELRERAVAAYEGHGHKRLVCREFKLARTTLDEWLKWASEGRLAPQGWARSRTHTIQDWDAFGTFVARTSFQTVKELQGYYNAYFPRPISLTSLGDALQRIA